MFQRVRTHITPATSIAIVALVLALTGGAFAATGGSAGGNDRSSGIGRHATLTATAAKAKAKPKSGARGPAGPKGATGAAGAAGPAGSAGATGPGGAQGPQGPAGNNGTNGENGKEGAAGAGVTNKELKSGNATCKEGGAEFTVGATKTHACNGEKGPEGNIQATLPSGKTETGVWAFGNILKQATHNGVENVPISFNVPLAAPLSNVGCEEGVHPATCHVYYINTEGEDVSAFEFNGEGVPVQAGKLAQTACPGSAAKPEATPGNLCVYEASANHAVGTSSSITAPGGNTSSEGAGLAGALMQVFIGGGENQPGSAEGTWAVTAE
jgi:hypothetical protein